MIGRTRYGNLLLNCGHGALGFTLAMGAAKLVSAMIDNAPLPIPAEPYRL